MKKQTLARIMLVGFVLLLLNIVIFQYFLLASVFVYVIIAFLFILTNGKKNIK